MFGAHLHLICTAPFSPSSTQSPPLTEEGIARLVAYVSDDNHPVRGWIARSGGTVRAYDGDATLYSIPIDQLAQVRTAA